MYCGIMYWLGHLSGQTDRSISDVQPLSHALKCHYGPQLQEHVT